MLHSLIYISSANPPLSDAALETLLHHAAQNNQQLGITGFLCSNQGVYFQYLEGSSVGMQSLMTRIKADPRHRVNKVLDLGELEQRNFPDWCMRRIRIADFAKNQAEIDLETVLNRGFLAAVSDQVLAGQVHRIIRHIVQRDAAD
jgi:hypothetical protein